MMTCRDTTLRDAGIPLALEGTPLAAEFRYWAGASGRRYLARVMALEEAVGLTGAPVVLAAVDGFGRREAVWVGVVDELGFAAPLAACSVGAREAHVHLLGESAADRQAVIRDLQAAIGGRCSVQRALPPGEVSAVAGDRNVAA